MLAAAYTKLTSYFSQSKYSFCERIVRTAVFQIGVAKEGYLEKVLLRFFGGDLDEKRGERALVSLKAIGAKDFSVTTGDRKGRIFGIILYSRDFEQQLRDIGGRWERVNLVIHGVQRVVFAIIPPLQPTSVWHQFERDIARFHWARQAVDLENRRREIIITCDSADCIPEHATHKKMFLHANSASVSFIMLWQRMGFYLGCKQNICFYDPRGTWKSVGTASEEGYYSDIKSVYTVCRHDFSIGDIWISGACAGVNPAGHLKSLCHQEGINFIHENGFTDLRRDFISHLGWFPLTFVHVFWKAISNKPEGFSLEHMWRSLPLSKHGKLIVITVANDQRIPPQVGKHNFEVAQRVNEQSFHFSFTSTKKDAHFDRYFFHEKIRRDVLVVIYREKVTD